MIIAQRYRVNILRREGIKIGLHIVLYQPEIPANTGNIARTCLGTNTTLHLIHPLGFSTDSKMVKRAGLDYWEHVHIHEHDSIEALYTEYPDGIFYYIENFGTTHYTDAPFDKEEGDIFLVFGKETTGIPRKVVAGNEERCLLIPTTKKIRSLNLSNAVAIVLFEALRQRGFSNIE